MAKGWSFGALVKALKGAAFLDIGTVANSVAAGNDSRIVGAAQKGNNLADLTDYAKARNQLSAAYIHGDTNIKFWALDSPGDNNSVVTIGRLNTVANTKANLNGDTNIKFWALDSPGDSNSVVTIGRLNTVANTKADTNGNQYTQFNVGGATDGTHAVRLDQFQSGNDGNGAWVRLPGGAMWCRVNLVIAPNATATWTFPMQFPGSPTVFSSVFNGENRVWFNGISSSGCNIYNPQNVALNVNLLAMW